MDQTTTLVNEHRISLGRPPVESADARELLHVEACASYGADRWEPGVLQDVLSRLLLDEEIILPSKGARRRRRPTPSARTG
jgi:hypothetical protein